MLRRWPAYTLTTLMAESTELLEIDAVTRLDASEDASHG